MLGSRSLVMFTALTLSIGGGAPPSLAHAWPVAATEEERQVEPSLEGTESALEGTATPGTPRHDSHAGGPGQGAPAPLPPTSDPGSEAANPQPPAPPALSDPVVDIRFYAYAPETIRIRAGQSVTWTNEDAVAHTVTAEDRSWGSEDLRQGESFVMRFDRPGRYDYFCAPHPMMKGAVEVLP